MTTLLEACWRVNVRMGAEAHAVFLVRISSDIAGGGLTLTDPLTEDVVCTAELVWTCGMFTRSH